MMASRLILNIRATGRAEIDNSHVDHNLGGGSMDRAGGSVVISRPLRFATLSYLS